MTKFRRYSDERLNETFINAHSYVKAKSYYSKRGFMPVARRETLDGKFEAIFYVNSDATKYIILDNTYYQYWDASTTVRSDTFQTKFKASKRFVVNVDGTHDPRLVRVARGTLQRETDANSVNDDVDYKWAWKDVEII